MANRTVLHNKFFEIYEIIAILFIPKTFSLSLSLFRIRFCRVSTNWVDSRDCFIGYNIRSMAHNSLYMYMVFPNTLKCDFLHTFTLAQSAKKYSHPRRDYDTTTLTTTTTTTTPTLLCILTQIHFGWLLLE